MITFFSCLLQVLGKMKDEFNGSVIEEVIALRPKMYSILTRDGTEKMRAKGVKQTLLKREIRHMDYRRTLLLEEAMQHKACFLRSDQHHQVHMVEQNKRGLCCYDDKRYLLTDGITSLPYGHYRIGKN